MSTTGDKILDTALSKVKGMFFLYSRSNSMYVILADGSFVICVLPFMCRLERRASSPKSWKMHLKEMSKSLLFCLSLWHLVLFGTCCVGDLLSFSPGTSRAKKSSPLISHCLFFSPFFLSTLDLGHVF